MTDVQQREAARQFYHRWKDKGNEDQDARDLRSASDCAPYQQDLSG